MRLALDPTCLAVHLAVGWTVACQVDTFSRHLVVPGSEAVLRSLFLSLRAALRTVLVLRLTLILLGMTSAAGSIIAASGSNPAVLQLFLGLLLATALATCALALMGLLGYPATMERVVSQFQGRLGAWYQIYGATETDDTKETVQVSVVDQFFTLFLRIKNPATFRGMVAKHIELLKGRPSQRAPVWVDDFGLPCAEPEPPNASMQSPHAFLQPRSTLLPTHDITLDKLYELERAEPRESRPNWGDQYPWNRCLSHSLTINEYEAYLEALAYESDVFKTDTGRLVVSLFDQTFRYVVDLVEGGPGLVSADWKEEDESEISFQSSPYCCVDRPK